MEEDRYIQGNILFTELGLFRMKTTNGSTTSVVFGEANSSLDSTSLPGFGGFYQLNETLVVSVDITQPCIRLVDRTNFNQATTYAGLCRMFGRGYEDGENARFGKPLSILLDIKNSSRLLVTDKENDAIREIHVESGFVDTFYKVGKIYGPKDMHQDSVNGDLYITDQYSRIFILRYNSLDKIQISSSNEGYFDGSFQDARFQQPAEMYLINGRTALLVADHGNHRLRIMDLVTNSTTSVCSGAIGHNDSDLETCSLDSPRSLLIIADTLYIGDGSGIRQIKGELIKVACIKHSTPMLLFRQYIM